MDKEDSDYYKRILYVEYIKNSNGLWEERPIIDQDWLHSYLNSKEIVKVGKVLL